jgi:hypothetical protein
MLILLLLLLSACEGEQGPPGPQGPEGPAGPRGPEGPAGAEGAAVEAGVAELTCTECHNDTGLISGHQATWSESLHGSGEAFLRASNPGCAGCHSGATFSARVVAGQSPADVEEGDPNPTRQDCRTCHQIHTTYTGEDFALETTDPVTLYVLPEVTFDGGKGNLCANCHQPRAAFPEAVDGNIEITSIRFGPHYGQESMLLLGVGGTGVEGSPSVHYGVVEDTCVTCHLGNHTFVPVIAACQTCHADAENFDINGVQTRVEELFAELEAALLAKGMISGTPEEGYLPVPGTYPEAEVAALWNYRVLFEDRSRGVHNPDYTIALLEASIEALR